MLEAIERYIAPTSGDNLITLPHLAGELKRWAGDTPRGLRQLAYDAADPVEGRRQASIILNDVDELGVAHVVGFVTDGRYSRLSVHYFDMDESGETAFREW